MLFFKFALQAYPVNQTFDQLRIIAFGTCQLINFIHNLDGRFWHTLVYVFFNSGPGFIVVFNFIIAEQLCKQYDCQQAK